MIPFTVFILIIMTHFLADFGIQTHKQAMEKSTNVTQLFHHVLIYGIIWVVMSYVLFESWGKCLVFGFVTFTFHYVTDFYSSRVSKPFWDEKDYHNAWVIVGADQVLHLLQLFGVYLLLK